jgi:hypothetical protein
MVIEQDLPAASTRTHGPAPLVSHGDDRRQVPCPLSTGIPERHQLGTRATGEMEEVDAAVHPARLIAYGSAHAVDEAIAVQVHNLTGVLDQLYVIGRQIDAGEY